MFLKPNVDEKKKRKVFRFCCFIRVVKAVAWAWGGGVAGCKASALKLEMQRPFVFLLNVLIQGHLNESLYSSLNGIHSNNCNQVVQESRLILIRLCSFLLMTVAHVSLKDLQLKLFRYDAHSFFKFHFQVLIKTRDEYLKCLKHCHTS